MSEYDDDKKWKDKLDRARRDPSVSPNQKFALEKKVKAGETKKLASLRQQMARKELMDKQKKHVEQMSKKGVQSADQKQTAEQIQKQEKMHEDAQKQIGQTETPTAAV